MNAESSLQRHPSLQPLSRDHGVDLVCVEVLQRAVRSARQERIRLGKEMKSICNRLILSYLKDEDAILFPVIPTDELKEKFVHHHQTIHKLTAALANVGSEDDPGLGLLARVADAIDDYVRWEEHVLFPVIEANSGREVLEHLYNMTSEMEATRNRPTQTLHKSVQLWRT